MLSVLAFALAFINPTDLVFVRHGETVANATGRYNSRTLNVLSKKGEAEVTALTERLTREPKFDRILVSPSPRALLSIAPYLRATHQRATIWPLLYECCTGRRPKNARSTHFDWGAKIVVPKELTSLFVLLRAEDRYPNSPDYNSGLAQVDVSIDEFRRQYMGGRILLVGHSGHGGQFLHALTGKWKKVENATEMRFQLK